MTKNDTSFNAKQALSPSAASSVTGPLRASDASEHRTDTNDQLLDEQRGGHCDQDDEREHPERQACTWCG
jgi:hypothetical protein